MDKQYISPFQPSVEENNLKAMGYKVGRNIFEKAIIYGFEIVKFVTAFTIDALKSVLGR